MAIHIKPSHKGKLHDKLHIPRGKPIPLSRIKAAEHSSDPAERKEAHFADNARHWNHGGRVGRKKGTLRARMKGHHHHPEHRKV